MNFTRKSLILISTVFLCLFALKAFAAAPFVDTAVTAGLSIGSSKPGEEVFITATFKDPDGWENLQWVLLAFWPTIDTGPGRRIWCIYRLDKNGLSLFDHNAKKYLYYSAPGSKRVIGENENQQTNVTLSCARTTVSKEGDTVVVTYALTFKEEFVGEKYTIYQYARDLTGIKVKKVNTGTWEIKERVPRTLRFQGMLKDNQENLLNGTVDLTFRLYDAVTEGALIWEETQYTTAVDNGLLDVELGSVTTLDLPFDRQYWLGVQVAADPAELTPRFKLTSVPYAVESD